MKAAVVQDPPVYFDLNAGVTKAVDLLLVAACGAVDA